MTISTLASRASRALGATAAKKERPGFWRSLFEALIAARRVEGEMRIRGHVAGLSDRALSDLGFSQAEIRELRAGKSVGSTLGSRLEA